MSSVRPSYLSNFIRRVLFIYTALVVCPIAYWPATASYDNSWYLAVNLAANRHMVPGHDFVWTTGPLAYLAIPMDVGSNLIQGLAFQLVLWLVVLAILWGVFFRSNLQLRNLVCFAILIGLSSRIYQYPEPLGAAEVMLLGALVLLLQFQVRGGMARYVVALVMLGCIPLIKFIGLITVLGLIAGLIVDRIVHWRADAWREILLAATVPVMVTGTCYWLTLGSFHAIAAYIHASVNLSSGYSGAMSISGFAIQIVAAFEALVILAIALMLLAAQHRRLARFLAFLLAVPTFISFKHGFVRQDHHVMYFFCFVAISLALVVLAASFNNRRTLLAPVTALLVFAVLWQSNVGLTHFRAVVASVTAVRPTLMLWHAFPLDRMRSWLRSQEQYSLPANLRLEPEIRSVVGHEPVAILSMPYSYATVDDLNLSLYPVLQRYAAYTPLLDQLNADWVRDKGPRFMIFDGQSIDGRQPWTETPAMWVEIYRWYNLRMLGQRNLLLERRDQARFTHFVPFAHSRVRFGDTLWFPTAAQPVFWKMQCSLNTTGKLQSVLFRVPEITVTLDEGMRPREFRVLPDVLVSPSMGNQLPSDLVQFAAVFDASKSPDFSVKGVTLNGAGTAAYGRGCEVELSHPAP